MMARDDHTASVLPDGKVLVAGGYSYDSSALNSLRVLKSAELYDPSSGNWTSTRSMTDAREGHTASILSNRRVLVIGGYNYDTGIINSAELYDPSTETWTNTDSMYQARTDHTASVLSDGKVLVTGGWSGDDFISINSSELYDPSIGLWTTTHKSMNQARADHTASVLSDGKILVTGGSKVAYLGYLNSSELYDPSTSTWTNTADLNQERAKHTASVLSDGKVLIAGGENAVFIVGATETAELYDPPTGIWTFTDSMNDARECHTATVLANAKVLVTGGVEGVESSLNSTELY